MKVPSISSFRAERANERVNILSTKQELNGQYISMSVACYSPWALSILALCLNPHAGFEAYIYMVRENMPDSSSTGSALTWAGSHPGRLTPSASTPETLHRLRKAFPCCQIRDIVYVEVEVDTALLGVYFRMYYRYPGALTRLLTHSYMTIL
jgi:hypothetical protein